MLRIQKLGLKKSQHPDRTILQGMRLIYPEGRGLRRVVFLKLFPDKKNTLNKIIRENHLNVREEDDFVKIIELINKEVIF